MNNKEGIVSKHGLISRHTWDGVLHFSGA